MEKISVNMYMLFAQALATNKKSYKFIDKYFYKNIEENLKTIKENDSNWSKHKIISEGSMEQEYYFKKVLALLETEGDISYIFEIVKNSYPRICNYLNSKKKLILSDLYIYLGRKEKNLSLDEFHGSLIVAIIIAINMEGYELDLTDEVYNRYMYNLSARLESYNREINFNNLNKEIKQFINKVYLNLRANYLKEIIPFPHQVPVDLINNTYEKELNDLDRKLLPFDFICELENIDLVSITSSVKMTESDIKNIISVFLNYNKYDSVVDVDYKELYKFVVNSMNFMYLAREYKNSKKFFFKNLQEELKFSVDENNRKLSELEKNNLSLKEELKKLKNENELLKNENNSLTNEIDKFKNSNTRLELIELRNKLFENNKDNFIENLDEIDINLNDYKGAVFGGHPNWISKMKNELKNWIFISSDILNFDIKILNDVEYVFVNTNYVSHGMYYKIIENLNQRNKLKYINNTNVDLCIKEIKSRINKN